MCQLKDKNVIASCKESGFTMIELVMVIVIMGVLAGVAVPIISQGIGAVNVTQDNLRTLQKLRFATERLAREIRQINHNGVNYDITTMTASQLVFGKTDTAATTVTINQGGGSVSLGYSIPAVSATLTDEVTAFNIVYYDAANIVTASTTNVAFVEVTLTLQNSGTGASFSQRTRVALRDQS